MLLIVIMLLFELDELLDVLDDGVVYEIVCV